MRCVQLSLMIAVALLTAMMPPPASAQGVGEGRMRILGRATVEAVPDHVNGRASRNASASSLWGQG